MNREITYTEMSQNTQSTTIVVARIWEKHGKRIVFFSRPTKSSDSAFMKKKAEIDSYDLNSKEWRGEARPQSTLREMRKAIEQVFADVLEFEVEAEQEEVSNPKQFSFNEASEIAAERAQYYYDAAIEAGESEEQAQVIFDEWLNEFEDELMSGEYDLAEYERNKQYIKYTAS